MLDYVAPKLPQNNIASKIEEVYEQSKQYFNPKTILAISVLFANKHWDELTNIYIETGDE